MMIALTAPMLTEFVDRRAQMFVRLGWDFVTNEDIFIGLIQTAILDYLETLGLSQEIANPLDYARNWALTLKADFSVAGQEEIVKVIQENKDWWKMNYGFYLEWKDYADKPHDGGLAQWLR